MVVVARAVPAPRSRGRGAEGEAARPGTTRALSMGSAAAATATTARRPAATTLHRLRLRPRRSHLPRTAALARMAALLARRRQRGAAAARRTERRCCCRRRRCRRRCAAAGAAPPPSPAARRISRRAAAAPPCFGAGAVLAAHLPPAHSWPKGLCALPGDRAAVAPPRGRRAPAAAAAAPPSGIHAPLDLLERPTKRKRTCVGSRPPCVSRGRVRGTTSCRATESRSRRLQQPRRARGRARRRSPPAGVRAGPCGGGTTAVARMSAPKEDFLVSLVRDPLRLDKTYSTSRVTSRVNCKSPGQT